MVSVQCIIWRPLISNLDSSMDINQIRTFVTIAEARSFSRAGGSLHRSQPAISRRIELLEQELGIALFDRLRGGVALTDAGAALLPYATSVLAAMKDGLTAVEAVRSGDAGRISLALVGALASDAFTRVLRKFQRKHSAVRLDIQTATSQEVEELVLRGEATFGLRYAVSQYSDLVSQVIGKTGCCSLAARIIRLLTGANIGRSNWRANGG